MTILAFPSLVPNQVTWHLEPNTGVFVSPLSRSSQSIDLPGARWLCDMTLPPMRADAWRTYTAWLAKMRGQSGRVYMTPPHYRGSTAATWTVNASAVTCDSTVITCDSSTTTCNQTSRAHWGTPVIDGANQTGTTVNTSGWVNDVTVLEAGNYISYDTAAGRSLHIVVEDAVSDGFGNCAIEVEPPIRTSPTDGGSVNTQTPTCIMTLQSDMAGAPQFGLGLRASVGLALVEMF